jgi:hypothetical protein
LSDSAGHGNVQYVELFSIFSCYTDTTKTTFCESGFNPLYTIIFGVVIAVLVIVCIILMIVKCIITLKKDNDLLKYQKFMCKELSDLVDKLEKSDTSSSQEDKESPVVSASPPSVEGGLLKSDTSASRRAKASPNLSASPPATVDRLDSDGLEQPMSSALEERSEQRRVNDNAHRGASKSRTKQSPLTEKPAYKSSAVYPGMKRVLKLSNLSTRKYKIAKKQLQEQCGKMPLLGMP